MSPVELDLNAVAQAEEEAGRRWGLQAFFRIDADGFHVGRKVGRDVEILGEGASFEEAFADADRRSSIVPVRAEPTAPPPVLGAYAPTVRPEPMQRPTVVEREDEPFSSTGPPPNLNDASGADDPASAPRSFRSPADHENLNPPFNASRPPLTPHGVEPIGATRQQVPPAPRPPSRRAVRGDPTALSRPVQAAVGDVFNGPLRELADALVDRVLKQFRARLKSRRSRS